MRRVPKNEACYWNMMAAGLAVIAAVCAKAGKPDNKLNSSTTTVVVSSLLAGGIFGMFTGVIQAEYDKVELDFGRLVKGAATSIASGFVGSMIQVQLVNVLGGYTNLGILGSGLTCHASMIVAALLVYKLYEIAEGIKSNQSYVSFNYLRSWGWKHEANQAGPELDIGVQGPKLHAS